MTSATDITRVPLAVAEAVAAELVKLLAPACERIEVAGSVRRRKATCKDVEIVLIPKLSASTIDLFGQCVNERNEFDELCADLLDRGQLFKRPDVNGRNAWGNRYKRAAFKTRNGAHLLLADIFSVLSPAQWGVIYAIRTGPAAFSHRLVTSRYQTVDVGEGRKEPGFLSVGYKVERGALWFGDRMIATPTEESFFEAIKLPYLAPEER